MSDKTATREFEAFAQQCLHIFIKYLGARRLLPMLPVLSPRAPKMWFHIEVRHPPTSPSDVDTALFLLAERIPFEGAYHMLLHPLRTDAERSFNAVDIHTNVALFVQRCASIGGKHYVTRFTIGLHDPAVYVNLNERPQEDR